MKYSYLFNGKKVTLKQDLDYVAVRFRDELKRPMRETITSAIERLGSFDNRREIYKEKFTILPLAQVAASSREARPIEAIEAIKKVVNVLKVNPVFKHKNKTILPTDRVIVGFKAESPNKSNILKKYSHSKLREENENEYVLQLNASEDSFDVCKLLVEHADVEYAEPDFVTMGKHLSRATTIRPTAGNDPKLSQQYAAKVTKAIDAWGLQEGKRNITVAILDEGVDVDHEDLKAVIRAPYDAVDGDNNQQPKDWDGHGTACAGLAVAIPKNNVGIRGIGGGCSLMPVRIAYSASSGGNWTTSNSWIARSIDHAWRNGADVLSNSWSGGAPSNVIANAFTRARTQGRNGKGCVIVIAAGNEAGPVGFPATLPNVLAISASNEYDEFKTKTSRDGESWWGSNYGPEISIAAPGVHNLTTDISRTAGYDPGNYTPTFNGTSSATPIVAGAAALILSANPNLTWSEVYRILKETADKVGAGTYVNGRNDQFGYGRLNVFEAIKLVLRPTVTRSVSPGRAGFFVPPKDNTGNHQPNNIVTPQNTI